MIEKQEIIELLQKKQSLDIKLNTLVYGSIEIREKNNKKYLYVHYREDGRARTKYVGEYSDELYNLILNNNIHSKEIKREIRTITKRLKELEYNDEELDDNIKLNIDIAKRNLVDTIYKQARLEGIATTFADTENIIEGGIVNNMTSDDVMKIVNLKHAWEFILNKNVIKSPTDFVLLCEINKIVEEGFYYNAGKIRSTPVSIGGTSWKPALPIESKIKEEISQIISSDINPLDKAIELLLFTMKKQIFLDGNKRTAVIFANQFLISNSAGIIMIPSEKVNEFKKMLIDYYEENDTKRIISFLKKECYTKL